MPDDPTDYAQRFVLTLLTSDAELAVAAARAGVQRIGVDIERNGKAARQAGFDTRISDHSWEDLRRISSVLDGSDIFIRLNPPHAGSAEEVERALDLGATSLMLPYFHSEAEAACFVARVRGRAHAMLLVETPRALVRIAQIAAVPGAGEIMVGLNDLRLTMGLEGMEMLASPVMDAVSRAVRESGKRFSFGGLARHDDASLPADPDLVYAQYPRLGASGAWLARSFFHNPPRHWTIAQGVRTLRARLAFWAARPDAELEHARRRLAQCSSGNANRQE